MSKRVARVTCKTCYQVFTREEWLSETECTNPKCSCPKVQKAFEMTQQTINQAKGTTTPKTLVTKNEVMIPEKAYSDEETSSCVWVEVPMVQTFRVSPINKRK